MHEHDRAQGATASTASPAPSGPALRQPTDRSPAPDGADVPPPPVALRPVWHRMPDAAAPSVAEPAPGAPAPVETAAPPVAARVASGPRGAAPVPGESGPAAPASVAPAPAPGPPASVAPGPPPSVAPGPPASVAPGPPAPGHQHDVRAAARASLAAGRSPSLWWVCTGLVVSVLVAWTLGAAEGALVLAALLAVSAVARAVLRRGPVALTVRSRTLDTAVLLGLALGVGILAQVIPTR